MNNIIHGLSSPYNIKNTIMDSTRTQARPPRPRHAQMQSAQPAATPTWKDLPPDDDLVPSLPPDWQPPAFLAEDRLTSESESSEEVKNGIEV